MLSDISWGAYLTTVAIFLGMWYGLLVFRFYRLKFYDVIKGRSKLGEMNMLDENSASPFSEFKESFDTLKDAEELYTKIIKVFIESDAGSVSRTEFLNYLRFVLEQYPFVRQSALREKINSLMVLEGRKYPDLPLTAEEADSLWEVRQ